MLVKLAMEHHVLVPVIATFISRLLQCETHSAVGDRFLQTLDRRLIPILKPGYGLSFYFPLLEKIAGNAMVTPKGVLELLKRHMVCLSDEHGPDTEFRSWSQGSRVLGICRVLLKNHNGSQVFSPLSRLLALTCQKFPDLEVRDNARSVSDTLNYLLYFNFFLYIVSILTCQVIYCGDRLNLLKEGINLHTVSIRKIPKHNRSLLLYW
jgi:AP-5 complex subunit beta-1